MNAFLASSIALALGLARPDLSSTQDPAEGAPPPEAKTVKTSFELIPDIETYQRPSWCNDTDYTSWPEWGVGAVGEAKDFINPRIGIKNLRSAAARVEIDANGDGKGDLDVPLTGNISPVHVKFGPVGMERDLGLLMVTGIEKDRYQGVEVDRSIRTERGQLFFAPAGSVTAMIEKTPIRIFDDNFDGAYGYDHRNSYWMAWRWTGLRYEHDPAEEQPEIDCVVVGGSKRARPWSDQLQIDGKWYQFKCDDYGRTLTYWPIQPATGTLKLAFKGAVKPAFVVVRGASKENEKLFFDLLEGGSAGVQVPEGRYKLFFGMLRQGKRREVQKCLILPSKDMDGIDVTAGKTSTLELGGPFGFDFVATDDGDSVTLIGKTAGVIGAAGEHYTRIWNAAPRPEMSVRKAGGKKADVTERAELVTDQDSLSKGWEYTWFPLDKRMPKKLAEEKAEVQLHEKKNKLLGEIESIWRAAL
jgi:hypothetical protein